MKNYIDYCNEAHEARQNLKWFDKVALTLGHVVISVPITLVMVGLMEGIEKKINSTKEEA